jgi:hypothetical protein
VNADKSVIEFDESGLPKGAVVPPIQNFFFLIFYSNPQLARVYIYVDGDEHCIMLNHKRFVDLIISLAGYQALPAIHEALSTYGTFWMYDRENNRVQRVVIRGNDDIRTIQGQIQKALKRETTPQNNPINPAEHLAYSPFDLTTSQKKNPFERDADLEPDKPLSVTIKRKKQVY